MCLPVFHTPFYAEKNLLPRNLPYMFREKKILFLLGNTHSFTIKCLRSHVCTVQLPWSEDEPGPGPVEQAEAEVEEVDVGHPAAQQQAQH